MAGVLNISSLQSTRNSPRDHKRLKHRRRKYLSQKQTEMELRRQIHMNVGKGTTTETLTSKQPATEPVVMEVAQEEVVPSAGAGIMRDPDKPKDVSAKTTKVCFKESTEVFSSGPAPEFQEDQYTCH